MSRAQWLAFGSTLALTGCSASGSSSASNSYATVATSTWVSPASCPSPAPGLFFCSDAGVVYDGATNSASYGYVVACDRVTELCSLTNNPQCLQKADAASPVCLTCPTCACLLVNGFAGCRCEAVDDAGGIALDCTGVGGCYGSPPARLERIRRFSPLV